MEIISASIGGTPNVQRYLTHAVGAISSRLDVKNMRAHLCATQAHRQESVNKHGLNLEPAGVTGISAMTTSFRVTRRVLDGLLVAAFAFFSLYVTVSIGLRPRDRGPGRFGGGSDRRSNAQDSGTGWRLHGRYRRAARRRSLARLPLRLNLAVVFRF